MKYTLHQLQIFQKVVRLESISRAAEELHMTQPAVSIQMRNFQDQFEIPLTEIIGRKLHVTEFGYEISRMADEILDQVEAINYKTMTYQGLLAGYLKISSVSTGKYILPYLLSGFLKQHEGIDLEMDVTNKKRVVESLEKNEIDFALVSVLPDKINVEDELLLDNTLYLVGREIPGGKDRLTREDLKSLTLIMREEGSATRASMEAWMTRNDIQVKRKMQLTSNEAVKQAVMAGIGYSVMPLIGLLHQLENEQLVIIPAEGLPRLTQWRIIWLEGKKLSPVSQAFLDYIRREKAKIIGNQFKGMEKWSEMQVS